MNSVLIVEDNSDLQKLYKTAVKNEGLVPLIAGDGQEALRMLKTLEQQPCVILLDLMMPVMDGWQFMEEYSRDPDINSIPVVVCSAAKGPPPKCARVMRKPVELNQLIEVLYEYCSESPRRT